MDFTKPVQELTIAFDFDWTLCEYPTLEGAGIANEVVLHLLKKFIDAGANTIILTARDDPRNIGYEKDPWNQMLLEGKFFSVKDFLRFYEVPEIPVYFTNGERKGPYLERLNVDILIDDSEHEHTSAQEFNRASIYPEEAWQLAFFFNH